jgi:hypothetical protein
VRITDEANRGLELYSDITGLSQNQIVDLAVKAYVSSKFDLRKGTRGAKASA